MSTPAGRPADRPDMDIQRKTGAGTSAGPHLRAWVHNFHGIIDEVYFPFIDQPNTRDLGLLVADGVAIFYEENETPSGVSIRTAVPCPPDSFSASNF